jgi:hypothetical protein
MPARQQPLVERALDAIAIVDALDAQTKHLFGYSREEPLGHSIQRRTREDDEHFRS